MIMTKSIRVAAATVLAVSMLGCAVGERTLMPTGGSRADGTVRMSYELGLFDAPRIDHSKTLAKASERCSAWGYDRAEAFGGQTRICQSASLLGDCVQWLVTIEFQCITDTARTIAPDPAPAPSALQPTNAPRE